MSNIKKKGDRILYQERKGASGDSKNYVYQDSTRTFKPFIVEDRSKVAGYDTGIVGWMQDVFLPQGYPDSVSSDYLHYQMWDTIQAYCSSIAGALSMKATFEGLGVGEGAATSLAATLTWLIKDGSGMVASIAFAYWRGSQLDCNCKQWRLFADVANDMGNLLRLLGPLLPVPFMVVMCASAVMMALVGVAGGATRAALTLHQARRNNMADVSAKDGSQETLVNLMALFTSITILPFITNNFLLTWVTFLTCVLLHLLANYQAVRAVKMESLNRSRLLHTLECWTTNAAVSSVQEANLAEPLFTGPAFIPDFFPHGFRIRVGCSFHEALSSVEDGNKTIKDNYIDIMQIFSRENFVLCGSLAKKQLCIVYREDIKSDQELEAFFTAYLCVLNYMHLTEGITLSAEYIPGGLSAETAEKELIAVVKEHAHMIFPIFLQELKAKGWNTSQLPLAAGEWRLL